MGNVCSSGESASPEEKKAQREARIKSKWIDEQLNTDFTTDQDVIKLLFLGSGESGKSTMLKQMKIIHRKDKEPFTPEDKAFFASLIQSNVVQSTKTLCKQSVLLAKTCGTEVQPQHSSFMKTVEELKYDEKLTPALADGIKRLWQDEGFRRTYKERARFQLNDSTAYFYDRLDDIVKPDYVPTEQDILRARIRTTGIVEHRVPIDGNEFRMSDVGGQRNARKKWIHCFDGVTSVIFVAALSDYNQLLYEDNKTNRMHEALNLFEDILRSEYFEKTAMILFLNKKDIFREKIVETPLTVCFPEYAGPNEYRAGCQYIKAKFKERNKTPDRRIYTHYTNATDSDNFRRVFDSVRKIILRIHLIDVGLMDPVANDVREDEYDEEDVPPAQ